MTAPFLRAKRALFFSKIIYKYYGAGLVVSEDHLSGALFHFKGNRKSKREVLYEHDVGGDAFSFRFHPIPISYELVKEGQIVPVLYSSNILDIIEFALRTCVEREITVRRCKNCGRYFARIGRGKVEYCGRSPAKGQATCRKTGAFQQWTIKQKDNPIFKVYRKEYKKRFAWIKAGRITAEAFYCWSRQAREKRDECKQGQLSLEEFQAWLKKED